MNRIKAYRDVAADITAQICEDVQAAGAPADPCYAERLLKATTGSYLATLKLQVIAAQAAYDSACAALEKCEGGT